MIRKTAVIENKLGVHTRAAAKIVDLAKGFESKIELSFLDRVVDAKSIMGVITLGAKKDHTIEVIIAGNDEVQAMESMLELIRNRFGEGA